MGHASKSQSIEVQNPRRSPFNMDLVWRKDVQHGRARIIEVECAYIPHAWVLEFLNGEQSHEDSLMEWNICKWVPPQKNVKKPKAKTTSLVFGMMFYCSFLLYYCFNNLILYWTSGLKLITHFVSMHVGMDLKTIMETQTTINSLNKVV